LAKWYCSETTGGRWRVLPTLPTPRMSMSCWNGAAASTSMPRLSRMTYSAVIVGRTLPPTGAGGSRPSSIAVAPRRPLSDLGTTAWTAAPMVQAPRGWAAAGRAREAATAAASRTGMRDIGVIPCGVWRQVWAAGGAATLIRIIATATTAAGSRGGVGPPVLLDYRPVLQPCFRESEHHGNQGRHQRVRPHRPQRPAFGGPELQRHTGRSEELTSELQIS